MSIKQFFSTLWKTLYKNRRNRIKEERFLKQRLAFVAGNRKEVNQYDKEILIIRTDDIGDYILFRNSLELVKKAWPDYKITLIGHALWQPIAGSWDKDFVDEFIWLQKGRFMKDEAYAQQFLQSIAIKKPEIIIAPSYSRNTFIDGVIAALIPAKEKYCWQRSDKEIRLWLRNYCDAPFTQTFPIPAGLHEFDLNKQFMEQITGLKLQYDRAFINPQLLPIVEGLPYKYVVLFPGAAAKRKRWDTKNFAHVADYITHKYSVKCLVCGSKGEGELAVEIIKHAKNSELIIDYTGKTDLLQLATVINGCELIITNDTSAAHYAAALGKNTIALLNGNSYGRFFPYPDKSHPNIKAIYPSNLTTPPHDWVGMENIDKIKVDLVEKEIEGFLM
jgi:ADP-heptose:LPS heptosyltransferase